MSVSFPNQIEPLSLADAAEMEHNNNYIASYINTEVITRGGSVAMTAPLKLLNVDPVSDDHATRKGYVDALLPIGTMMMYGSTVAPTGRWKICDGTGLQTALFPKLFAVLQYSYGGSAGTFNLPDLRHRVPIGVDTADARFSTAGKTGGSYDAVVAAHTHSIDHDHGNVNTGGHSNDHWHWYGHSHTASSGGISHNHYHGININTDWSGVHGHNIPARENPVSGSAGSLGISNAGGTIVNRTTTFDGGHHNHNVSGNTGTVSSDHTHAITVDAGGGASGGVSADHSHNVDLPPFGGTSGSTGAAGAQQVPSFVTITYIIRTD